MIKVRCLSAIEDIAPLRKQINALNLRSDRPDPFSSFEFYENFLQQHEFSPLRTNHDIWFLVAFQKQTLVGYLPLQRSTVRFLGIAAGKLDFLATHDTDRPRLVTDQALGVPVRDAFYRYLHGRRQEWSLLEFAQQDDSSLLWPPPELMPGCQFLSWPGLTNATIKIRWDSVHEYFKSLKKKVRSNVGRSMRSLSSAGELEILSSSDPAVTPRLLALFLEVEKQSWKSKADVAAIGSSSSRIGFFEGLLNFGDTMRTSIDLLCLNGIPIAGLINGQVGSRCYALQIAYDKQYQASSPGTAVLLIGVHRAIAGGCTHYDLLGGFSYYKHRWRAELTETVVAQIYRANSLLLWRRRAGDLLRKLLRRVDQANEALFNPARRDLDSPIDAGGTGDSNSGQASRQEISDLVGAIRPQCEGNMSQKDIEKVMPFAIAPAA